MTIFDAATVLLLQTAADRGDVKAQASLGVAYQLGEGVPQNDAQAIYWFRCSAELGDPWEFGISRRQLKLDYTRGAPAKRRLLPACSRKQYFTSILHAVRKIPGADAQHRH